MGAAMTGLRPIAELMFSDFFAVTWDMVINQIAKARYMTDGQVSIPIVLQTANGSGLRFGAQHSQSVENWAMAIPGLKVVAPSTPADVVGLMASAVRSDDPVIFCGSKSLFASKGEVPDGEHVVPLGQAAVVREGVRLHDRRPRGDGPAGRRGGRTPPRRPRDRRRGHRPAQPRPARRRQRSSTSVAKTSRLFTVEENPRLLGWGAEIVSIVADEGFWSLDAPIGRITTPHIPLPSAASLEDLAVPGVDRIVDTVRRRMEEAK